MRPLMLTLQHNFNDQTALQKELIKKEINSLLANLLF